MAVDTLLEICIAFHNYLKWVQEHQYPISIMLLSAFDKISGIIRNTRGRDGTII